MDRGEMNEGMSFIYNRNILFIYQGHMSKKGGGVDGYFEKYGELHFFVPPIFPKYSIKSWIIALKQNVIDKLSKVIK